LCCILLNSLALRFDMGRIDYQSLGAALQCPSSLLLFFSLSSLPVDIMNAVIDSGMPLSGTRDGNQRLPVKKQQTDEHANQAAAFSIARSGYTEDIRNSVSWRPVMAECGQRFLFPPGRGAPDPASLKLQAFFSWQANLSVFLLMACCFLLPRNSVNEEVPALAAVR
jgi:hypothetical protein